MLETVFLLACRAVFDGDITAAMRLLHGMNREEMLALDPQGNTVSPLASIFMIPHLAKLFVQM